MIGAVTGVSRGVRSRVRGRAPTLMLLVEISVTAHGWSTLMLLVETETGLDHTIK